MSIPKMSTPEDLNNLISNFKTQNAQNNALIDAAQKFLSNLTNAKTLTQAEVDAIANKAAQQAGTAVRESLQDFVGQFVLDGKPFDGFGPKTQTVVEEVSKATRGFKKPPIQYLGEIKAFLAKHPKATLNTVSKGTGFPRGIVRVVCDAAGIVLYNDRGSFLTEEIKRAVERIVAEGYTRGTDRKLLLEMLAEQFNISTSALYQYIRQLDAKAKLTASANAKYANHP